MNANKTARLSGFFFLLMVVFGLFAEVFFRQKLFVPANAAETAARIISQSFLFRAGIVSDLLMSVCYLFTAIALYQLLASVNRNLAAVMVLFAAAGSTLLLINLLNEYAPLLILSGGSAWSGFSGNQLQSLAILSFRIYEHGYMIGQVFFALWVLPLGILIYQSGFLPKVFGILFAIETVCGLLAVIIHFLIPSSTLETALLLPAMMAEFPFMFWLLIRGVK